MRFRRLLVARSLDHSLFDAVTAQLKAKAITVKTGTLVDGNCREDPTSRMLKKSAKISASQ